MKLDALGAVLPTDGSASDVQAKINSATTGDIISIPAGVFTWSTSITCNKAVSIQGQGSGRVIGRSTSTVSVGTGTKTFTMQSGLTINNGDSLIIQRTGGKIVGGNPDGTVPVMEGTVTSYSGTTLTMNIATASGNGSHPLWIISTEPSTTITNGVSGNMLTLTESSVGTLQLSGVKLFWKSGIANESFAILTVGAAGGKPIHIHDCYFTTDTFGNNGTVIRAQISRGIMYNCSCVSYPWNESAQPLVVYANGFDAWTSASTMGVADTGGTNNFYVEDCDFHGILNSTDMDDNARVVLRHNLFNNAGCGTHGADTSNYGVRHYEFYDNTFLFNGYNDGNTLNLGYFFFLRGGTGVFTDNVIPDITSTDFGDKSELVMIVINLRRNSGPNPCWGANVVGNQYPAPRQIGMGRITGNGTDGTGRSADIFTYVGDVEPAYIWNNTGTVPTPAIADDSTFPGACTNPDASGNYIVQNRDYILGSAKPSYTKYTYPHPLRQEVGGQTVATIGAAVIGNGNSQ